MKPGRAAHRHLDCLKYWWRTSVQPQSACFQSGCQDCFHEGLASLKSLPQIGTPFSWASSVRLGSPQPGSGTVTKWHALHERRIGVDHIRCDSGSLSFRPSSKRWSVAWTDSGSRKISVLPHHSITKRVTPCCVRKPSMSSRSCRAKSYLVLPVLICGPDSRARTAGQDCLHGARAVSSSRTASKRWGR